MVRRLGVLMMTAACLGASCTTDSERPTVSLQQTTTSITPTTIAPVTSIPEPVGFSLVWNDEFDGSGQPDPENWNVEHSTFGDGNNELQCYEPGQVKVVDGVLRLTAEPVVVVCPNGSQRQYRSGMVQSLGRRSFETGLFEIRAKFPAGAGLWPALWLSSETDPYGSWPSSGEIDMIEIDGGDPTRAVATMHYRGLDSTWVRDGEDTFSAPGTAFTDTFHVWSVHWEPRRVRWFVDGVQFHETANWQTALGPEPAPFDNPFFFRMNLAVGGTFVGDPDESTPWPGVVEVDYVRVYKQN